MLEFYNVNDLETMSTEEHYGATSVEWDPTGRFAVSCAKEIVRIHCQKKLISKGGDISLCDSSFHPLIENREMADSTFTLSMVER